MSTTSKPKIGFIGLGLMGSAMVQRLQSLGYPVTVVAHRNRKPIEDAVARGAKEVTTAGEVAKCSEIIMLCVDTSAAVEAVMKGEGGVLEQLQPDSVVIDFGTSIPGITRQLAQECQAKGAAMMDAPLGRTPVQAVDGLLNIMAAGDTADFERMKPVLEDLGENVYHVGPIGAGHTLKLINNFFGMTMACAMSEAFAMADLAGLKRQTLYDVMSAGPLKSGMMEFIKVGAVDNDLRYTTAGDIAMIDLQTLPVLTLFAGKSRKALLQTFVSPFVQGKMIQLGLLQRAQPIVDAGINVVDKRVLLQQRDDR